MKPYNVAFPPGPMPHAVAHPVYDAPIMLLSVPLPAAAGLPG